MNPNFYTPVTYDTAAINVAIAAANTDGGGEVILPAGVYNPFDISGNPVPIVGANNVHLRGVGPATVIRVTSLFQDYLINGQGYDHFSVSDMTLDMGDIDPVDTDAGSGAIVLGAISGVGGKRCSIQRIEIIGMGRYGIAVKGGSREITISHNRIERSVLNNASANIAILLRMDDGTANFFSRIEDNQVTNTVVCPASFEGIISRNIIRFSGFGAGIAMDDGPYCHGCVISDNLCENGTGTDYLGTVLQGFEIWGDSHFVHNNKAVNNNGSGFSLLAPNTQFVDNRAIGSVHYNGISLPRILVSGAYKQASNSYLSGNSTAGNAVSGIYFDPLTPGLVFGHNDTR